MNDLIEKYKQQIEDAKNYSSEKKESSFFKRLFSKKSNSGDWQTPYHKLIKEVYNQDVLFFALSKVKFNPETKTSVPYASTKDFDGLPSLYVFTDIDIATGWMNYYKHFSDDMEFGLIGAVKKKLYPNAHSHFSSIFQISRMMGVQMIMLDEGGHTVGIDMDTFFGVNEIDPADVEVQLSKEEYERMLANEEGPSVRYAPIPAIPLKKK